LGQLGIFPANISRCHPSNQKSWDAVQHPQPKEICVEENPRWAEETTQDIGMLTSFVHFACGEVGIKLDSLSVFFERVARVVEDLASERFHRPIDYDRLMNQAPFPAALASLEEAKFAVRIPAGV
jgi:hypothetical protein